MLPVEYNGKGVMPSSVALKGSLRDEREQRAWEEPETGAAGMVAAAGST